jgi:hypothetical protein
VWPNWQFGADYIGKKKLSKKCGDLRFIDITLPTGIIVYIADMLWSS